MFENLSERLERSFKILKGEGRITEINVAETLKDVQRALLDADVNYKVDLFYGDIGFTSDYANVLQFDSANARDSYFDAISEKDIFDNTDFNNIQLSGNTIKLAFVDATQIARLEKYNYIRILTRLYGGLYKSQFSTLSLSLDELLFPSVIDLN